MCLFVLRMLSNIVKAHFCGISGSILYKQSWIAHEIRARSKNSYKDITGAPVGCPSVFSDSAT